ncbi:DUF982 domain-containing protein [Rhizobium sp. LEGMi198b]|uniref:DUF982 domain-containing protein n=1 Tax=unclassified Rhizobium TaxID=2613769 RepID=UPI000CDF3880|nr:MULTISPECIES: DUF982 domain-containing protein [Rhizobium]AVA25878.1 hypothetical protein NXC24_PC01446 [Rhizobium sp. NXC24]MDK4741251.1 DUF982 domain-containing protein [Rhizobium sp. CNPSo 3464]UWU23613.1 DUF982 domain-containing protein [Rhizobium tropici]WFU04344.1 DUF982 domain-containing protein [Rhizobium sp. CB3171]
MKRNTLRPFPAVTLVMGGAEGYRRVNSVQDATETLLEHWPIEDGEEYVTAVRICLDAMMGVVCVEAAREAFIKAAKEAGVALLQ